MSVRQVIHYSTGLLFKKCRPVTFPLSQQTVSQIYAMKSTLKQYFRREGAVGLSANQIGIDKSIFIAISNLSVGGKVKARTPALVKKISVFINPSIIKFEGEATESEEYCISSLERVIKIPRHPSIHVEYYNTEGEKCIANYSGFRAKIFQHEMDHLQGKNIWENTRDLTEEEKNEKLE